MSTPIPHYDDHSDLDLMWELAHDITGLRGYSAEELRDYFRSEKIPAAFLNARELTQGKADGTWPGFWSRLRSELGIRDETRVLVLDNILDRDSDHALLENVLKDGLTWDSEDASAFERIVVLLPMGMMLPERIALSIPQVFDRAR